MFLQELFTFLNGLATFAVIVICALYVDDTWSEVNGEQSFLDYWKSLKG